MTETNLRYSIAERFMQGQQIGGLHVDILAHRARRSGRGIFSPYLRGDVLTESAVLAGRLVVYAFALVAFVLFLALLPLVAARVAWRSK